MLDEYNTPRFRNNHTSAQALGAAVGKGNLWYASYAGPNMSCDSIKASVLAKNAGGASAPLFYGHSSYAFDIEHKTKNLSVPLPQTNYRHFVTKSNAPGVIIIVDPEGAGLVDTGNKEVEERRAELRMQYQPLVKKSFSLFLLNDTDAPFLEEWIDPIWDQAQRESTSSTNKPIVTLSAYGDCIHAFKMDPEYDWPEMIGSMLARRIIKFPGQTYNEGGISWYDRIASGEWHNMRIEPYEGKHQSYDKRTEIAITDQVMKVLKDSVEKNSTYRRAYPEDSYASIAREGLSKMLNVRTGTEVKSYKYRTYVYGLNLYMEFVARRVALFQDSEQEGVLISLEGENI